MRHRGRRVLVLAAVLAAFVGLTAPPAAAGGVPRAPIVDIAVSPGGISVPSRHSSGVISFRVSTTVTGDRGSAAGVARLRPGTSPETFATHLGQVFTGDPETALAAGRSLMAEAELIGGAQVQPDQPATFTTWLGPGTYYVFDFIDFEFAPPAGPEALHELTITGDRHPGLPPAPRATVWSLRTEAGPAFRAPARLPAGQPLLFTNLMDQVNEAIFMPVQPGATDDDVQAYFESLEGGPPAAWPFTGAPVGSPPISPGRSTVLQMHLPPGRYALITWVFDLDDGRRLAAKGMHRIVTVT